METKGSSGRLKCMLLRKIQSIACKYQKSMCSRLIPLLENLPKTLASCLTWLESCRSYHKTVCSFDIVNENKALSIKLSLEHNGIVSQLVSPAIGLRNL